MERDDEDRRRFSAWRWKRETKTSTGLCDLRWVFWGIGWGCRRNRGCNSMVEVPCLPAGYVGSIPITRFHSGWTAGARGCFRRPGCHHLFQGINDGGRTTGRGSKPGQTAVRRYDEHYAAVAQLVESILIHETRGPGFKIPAAALQDSGPDRKRSPGTVMASPPALGSVSRRRNGRNRFAGQPKSSPSRFWETTGGNDGQGNFQQKDEARQRGHDQAH